jgi:hypothetical protein
VIEAPRHGWTSPATLAGLAGTAVILAGFAFWQVRWPDPMLDVQLFGNARFSAAAGAIALAFFGLFGFIFLITQYFQRSWPYPWGRHWAPPMNSRPGDGSTLQRLERSRCQRRRVTAAHR